MNKVLIVFSQWLLLFSLSCSTLPNSKSVQNDFSGPQFDLENIDSVEDIKLSQYLNSLLGKIKSKYPTSIRVTVKDTDVAQAIATEDEILISKAMLFAIQNEAELVAVLGHEFGHIKLKHLDEEFKESKSSEIVGQIAEETSGLPIGETVQTQIENIRYLQFNQKREQEADEFGVLAAHKLGYNPYAIVNLFLRLSQNADQQVLKNLIEGNSHKTLGQRAVDIRKFLQKKNLKNVGNLAETNYLKHVQQLAPKKPDPQNDPSLQKLTQISDSIAGKKKLTSEEFIKVMEQLRLVAKELNLLAQIDPPLEDLDLYQDDDEFMMELVRLTQPLWGQQNPYLNQIKSILTSLGRMGVGAIPVVGDAIDLYKVLTGRDFYTQEPLSYGERIASTLGFLVGTGHQWRQSAKGLKIVGDEIGRGKEISTVLRETEEVIEKNPLSIDRKKVLDSSGKINPVQAEELERNYRRIKNPESEKVLRDLADKLHEKKFPDDWKYKVSKPGKKGAQGLEIVHPEKEDIRVRIMPGNPNSPYPNSREPYVRQIVNGKDFDINGNIVSRDSNEAHIPLKDYKFRNFWKKKKDKI